MLEILRVQDKRYWSSPGTGREDLAEVCMDFALLPIPWIDDRDVTAAVLWLVSDEARYVTGIQLPVDGGTFLK